MDFDTWIGNADEALNAGDVAKAVSALAWAARGPGLHERPGELVVLTRRLLRAGRLSDMDDLVRSCSAVILDPDSGQGLYDLGWQLNGLAQSAIAVPVLRRLVAVAPHQGPLVAELVTALERDGQHASATALLLAEPELLGAFHMRYLLVFNAFMSANPAVALGHLIGLQADDDTERFLLSTVRGMADRYERVCDIFGLSEIDLRGWHYVLNGGLLLHLSTAGFADAMRGRYALVQDSVQAMRAGLERCSRVFERWGYSPATVLYLPDLGSRALAQAAAELWRVPCQAYSPGAAGCVVAYDLNELDIETQTSLRERSQGQIWYVHNATWTSPPVFCPYLVYMLSQQLVAPWQPQMRLDAQGQLMTSDMSDKPVKYWVDQVLEAGLGPTELAPGDSLDELLAAAATVGRPSSPERSRFWVGGPVASGRFG